MARVCRPWLSLECERLARLRAEGVTYAEIGRRLGRTKGCVAAMAIRLDLTRPRKRLANVEKLVRRLHGQGFSDTRIGLRLGLSRPSALRWRKRLGLPAKRTDTTLVRLSYERTCRKYGVKSLVELRRGRVDGRAL